MNNSEPLPETILIQLPSGIKLEATLLKWPVSGKPVYAVTLEQIEKADTTAPILP